MDKGLDDGMPSAQDAMAQGAADGQVQAQTRDARSPAARGGLSTILGTHAARQGRRWFGRSRQHDGKRFRNVKPKPAETFGKTLGIIWDMLFNKPRDTRPGEGPGAIPIVPLTSAALEAAPDFSLYRLGHSTLLFKLRDAFWLTDPVFAERASPFKRMGPKRFHAPPIDLDALPPLRAVILSHDHYDHLDRETVCALAAKTALFLTPLGVGDRLIEWGIDPEKVQQFDWWQGTVVDGIAFTATPAQHFSGRSLFDGNSTLWASWVIVDGARRFFFSGDTGYFDGFKEIGERLGPFDVTMMETGAYDKRWPYVHMQPEQTVQAHIDLRGQCMVPVHNGTFDLAMHRWQDPFERVSVLAKERGVTLSTPRIGERLDLAAPGGGAAWWTEAAPAVDEDARPDRPARPRFMRRCTLASSDAR